MNGSILDDLEDERARHGPLFAREDVLAYIGRILFGERPLYRGWVVLLGSPGVGKSALLVHLLDTLPLPAVHHFIRRGIEGRDRSEVAAQNLCAQIEQLFPSYRDADVRLEVRPGELLKRLSSDVLVPRNERLLLVIDGLDELAVNGPDENPLPRFLPEVPPPGVVILCATRPKQPYLRWLDQRIRAHPIDLNSSRWSASNEEACRAFWEHQSTQISPPLDRVFVDEAVRRAGGNMLHAIYLRDWILAQPVGQRVITNIPQGHGGSLEQMWEDVRRIDGARRALVMNGLGVACAAREALPAFFFGEILGWQAATDVDEFLYAARHFLVEEIAHWHDGNRAFRLYHESVRELVIEKLGAQSMREHHRRIAERFAAWLLGERDTPERTYALRHAVTHWLEAGDIRAAQSLCTDIGYLEMKCRKLGAAAVERDLEATARALGGAASFELLTILMALNAEGRDLRDDEASFPARLYNRLICIGWSAERIMKTLRFPAGRPALRLLYGVRLGSTQVRSFFGHNKDVVACAVTPDGLRVISASADWTLRLWTLGSGECIAVLRGHDGEVTGCAVTDGGRVVISSSTDATVKRWDLDSGCCVGTIPNGGRWATACAATRDGSSIAVGSDDGSVRLWNGRTLELNRTLFGHNDYITACTFTLDGACILTASRDGSVRAWSPATGACLYTVNVGESVEASASRGAGNERWVTALAVAPDGKHAFAASDDGFIVQWKLDSGRRIERFRAAQVRIDALAITRDGRHLLCGIADGTLIIWSLTAIKRADRLSAHAGAVSSCALTPDGRRVISASYDRSLKLWELSVSESLPKDAHVEPITACAVALEVPIAVSASEDRTLKTWDLESGAPRLTLEGHEDLVTACAISATAQYVASGARDGNIRAWDRVSGKCIRSLQGHAARVSGCAITRDNRLATVSHDRTVRLWTLPALDEIAVLGSHEDAVEGCASTPDGVHLLTLSRDGVVKVWNLTTGKLDGSLEGLGGGLLCGALTPDGRLAVLGRDDGAVEAYDIRSQTRLCALREHEGRVFGCAVLPDGSRFVSVSEDGTLRVWSLSTFTCIDRLRGARWFRCVAATRSRICAGDEEGNFWVLASSSYVARPARKVAPPSSSHPGARTTSAKVGSAMLNVPAFGASPPGPLISRLQAVLAKIYRDSDVARGVILEAGLNQQRINLKGSALVLWLEIIAEADNQNRLRDVVRIARGAYPDNAELADVARKLGFD